MKTLKQNLLKWLIVAILAFVAFCTKAQVAEVGNTDFEIIETETAECNSLATITGENVSYWDALAAHKGVDPTTWTVPTFRKYAVEYAESIGMVYDKSGLGNVAIVRHLVCSNAVKAATTVSTDTKRAYADDFADYTVFYNSNKVVVDTVWHVQHAPQVTIDTVTFQNSTEATHHVVMLGDSVIGSYTTDIVGPISKSDTVRIIDTLVKTVATVDTIVENWCDCSPSRSLAELWEDYMRRLPRAIKQEKDAGQRALLVGCRIKIGNIVRSAHRHGGRLVDENTNIRDAKKQTKGLSASPLIELPVEFCGLTSSLMLGVKAAKQNIAAMEREAKRVKLKRSNDLAQAKARQGWKRFTVWLKKTFGAPCRH